jgi:hypothetical protein
MGGAAVLFAVNLIVSLVLLPIEIFLTNYRPELFMKARCITLRRHLNMRLVL